MAKKHQYKISAKGTRSKAQRKWRRQANAAVRQFIGPVSTSKLPKKVI